MHYLQVTDDHYQQAVKDTTERGTESGTANAENTSKAAQNQAQHPAATRRTEPQETQKGPLKRALLPAAAIWCEALPDSQVPPRGVEQNAQSPGKTPALMESGTVCGTPGAPRAPLDADLRTICDAWPTLSPQMRAALLALLRASGT